MSVIALSRPSIASTMLIKKNASCDTVGEAVSSCAVCLIWNEVNKCYCLMMNE